MGLLVDGVWQQEGLRTKDGHFIRPTSSFRNWVTPDGSAGPSGKGGFPAEAGRYHLYVSLACPWAHRTIIFRKLKNLENVISMSVVSPDMMENGWTFHKDEGSTGDTVNGKDKLSEIYVMTEPKYTGRVSVPVLWDKKTNTIVNNESPEIIRMLNSAFDAFTNSRADFYPAALRAEIDRIDTALVDLIAERFGYVERAWQIKLAANVQQASVPWRNQQVIDHVRARSLEKGLPPDLAEALWRQMIGWFIQYEEEKLRDKLEAKAKDGGA